MKRDDVSAPAPDLSKLRRVTDLKDQRIHRDENGEWCSSEHLRVPPPKTPKTPKPN